MKTTKSILLAAALGLSSLTCASAQTYNIQLSNPTNAGSAQLAAGSYKLNVNGRIATFTNVESNKSVMVVVREGASSRRSDSTTLELKDENGTQRLESIDLGDASSVLEF